MEVAPEYWQYPQMLDRTYLSTAAGNPSGTAADSGAGRHGERRDSRIRRSRPRRSTATTNSLNGNAQANAVTNSISNSRGGSSTGSADSTAAETMVPLPAMVAYVNNHTATQVNHQNGLVAATISFNLPPGGSLSRAQAAITQAMHDLGMPASIHGSPAGAGQVFAQNMVDVTAAAARGIRRHLYRARHPVREHHPPDHHPLDAALRDDRRHPGAADLRHAACR